MMVQCWSSKCFIISPDKSAPLGNTKSPVVKLGFLRYTFHITSTSNKEQFAQPMKFKILQKTRYHISYEKTN